MKDDLFESDSEDSFDPEEYGSWTSIAMKGKSCGFGKEEGVELDAREARASWKDSQQQPQSGTIWSMNSLQEGSQVSGLPRMSFRKVGRRCWNAQRRLGKTRFGEMKKKQPFLKKQANRVRAHQTDTTEAHLRAQQHS